jgi:NADPH:quinone reductase-like Zn-dependent oxidoreductase
MSDQDTAPVIANPITAWVLTMVEHRMQPSEWLTQTAAGSAVGRLVLQLEQSDGFRTINIVRRRAQVEEIGNLGGQPTGAPNSALPSASYTPEKTDPVCGAGEGCPSAS